MRQLIATVFYSALLYVLPAFAVIDGDVRNPVETPYISVGSLLWWVIAAVVCWLISSAAHRSVFARAPTNEQRTIWTIALLLGGATIIGFLRSW
ncbi:MAG: hypothetical protein LC131_12440 [Anaerolineae bacterium]|nr:hypothetical protein [Anaerolineae bacterium]